MFFLQAKINGVEERKKRENRPLPAFTGLVVWEFRQYLTDYMYATGN